MTKLQPPDLDEAVRSIEKSLMEKARHVEEVGALTIAADISKAVSLIDVSRTARAAGDLGTAEASLDHARQLLLSILGIEP